jgi:hypothetical protein
MSIVQFRVARSTVLCGIALMAAAVAGCGTTTAPSRSAGKQATAHTAPGTGTTVTSTRHAAPATPPLPAGQEGSHQQIPWSQVGPGWFLAEWSSDQPHWPGQSTGQSAKPKPITLYLVDPAAGRYRIKTFPAGTSAPDYLMYWSGDGQRALLGSTGTGSLESTSAPSEDAILNLHTLATTTFRPQLPVFIDGFTAPDGLALISAGNYTDPFQRLSLTGQHELTYPAPLPQAGTYTDTVVYSADGNELALGTENGIELISNGGEGARFLPVSPSVSGCSTLRWWNSSEVLAGCMPHGSGKQQLWLVPTAGAKPTALTATPPASGDEGDLDAWQIPSGTYVHDAGACGYQYVAKLRPDGRTTPVTIPTALGSQAILGTQGDKLAILAAPACGEGGQLLWYAPATSSATPLLGGKANGGSVISAVMFGPASGS